MQLDVSIGRVIYCKRMGDGKYESMIDLTPQQRTPMKVHLVIYCKRMGDGKYESMIDLTPQQRTPMKVHLVGQRDGEFFAIVDTASADASGSAHGFTFQCTSRQADHDCVPHLMYDPMDYVDSEHPLTWVSLDAALGFEVRYARVLDGEVYLVIRSGDVPRGVRRSSIYGEVLQDFLNTISPASIDDAKRGPSAFANDLCWVRLRDLPGQGDVAKAESDRIDGLTREQCFERYQKAMQGEHFAMKCQGESKWSLGTLANTTSPLVTNHLTSTQLAVAREEWSARLHAKVKASENERRERDRNQVQLDIDPEDL